ncbi:MAG TPA: FmdB family zinc ribbon protein [Solirubrobacterales bacterium]|jgi:putative FmdB family regulatory protein|nr:FmdB family zinc ribbon protein [Solirubrobacterales bacterium]
MPIYEYKCDNGHVFDVIQRMTDEPLTKCEECGAPAARVLTPPAIHFKGSGFHNTDYGTKRGGNGGSEGGSEKSGDSGSSSESKPDSGKSDSKSESKPAASTAD